MKNNNKKDVFLNPHTTNLPYLCSMLPKKLQDKLDKRAQEGSVRFLGEPNTLVDFSSNDYLGFSTSKEIFNLSAKILKEHRLQVNGATGSRLLSGNHALYNTTEKQIANFHNTQAALIFNSGYDANVGFFSSVPQRGDIILYDELCHASIRDGIKMSNAKGFKFKHNSFTDIEKQLSVRAQLRTKDQELYFITESVFSMDGDQPDLNALVTLSKRYGAHLIVDEAHAIGVIGDRGEGLVQQLGLEDVVFARIVTFGKALGCHGAAVLGNEDLKKYLVNFARSFIYTTGLSPHSLAAISAAYTTLHRPLNNIQILKINIAILQLLIKENQLSNVFISSRSAIHSCIIGGTRKTKIIAMELVKAGFDVKPILSPTVPEGQERLRICIHSFNTETELKNLMITLSNLIKK